MFRYWVNYTLQLLSLSLCCTSQVSPSILQSSHQFTKTETQLILKQITSHSFECECDIRAFGAYQVVSYNSVEHLNSDNIEHIFTKRLLLLLLFLLPLLRLCQMSDHNSYMHVHRNTLWYSTSVAQNFA